jgi:hypothetical protein
MYAANKTMAERVPAYFETTDMMIATFGREGRDWIEHFSNAAADRLGSQYRIPRAYAMREARRLALAIWPEASD